MQTSKKKIRNIWLSTTCCCALAVAVLYSLGAADDLVPRSKDSDSISFTSALAMCIAVSLPMLLDSILDVVHFNTEVGQRLFVVFALFVPNVVAYYICTELEGDKRVGPLATILIIREILYTGGLINFLFHDGCSRKTVVASFLLGGSSLTAFLLDYIVRCSLIPKLMQPVVPIIYSISVLLAFVLLVKRWQLSRVRVGRDHHLIEGSLCFISIALKGISIIIFGSIIQTTLVDLCISVFIVVLPGRQARIDSVRCGLELHQKRDFVSYISHEIRTPLNIVLLGLEMLKAELLPLTPSQSILDNVEDTFSSCETAISILNQLLQVNKIEGGNLSLDRKVLPAADFISQTLRPFRIQACQKGVRLSTTMDKSIIDDKLFIDVDPSKFSQVIRNFVSNAIKFTDADGTVRVDCLLVSREIETASSSWTFNPFAANAMSTFIAPSSSKHSFITLEPGEDDMSGCGTDVESRPPLATSPIRILRIEVHDSGAGVSEENQKKLFSEIVQFDVNELQSGGGSGIGLWISKSIVDLHGGHMGMTSVLGEGSMFYVEIPIATFSGDSMLGDNYPLGGEVCAPSISGVEMAEGCPGMISTLRSDRESHNIRTGTAPDESVKSLRVCVVDDSAVNRKMLCKLLEPRVRSVSQCCDGKESVDLVQESLKSNDPFDLVLMDVNMPVMGGVQATTIIRNFGYKGSLVFLTGNAMPDEVVSYMDAGGDAVVIKPCSISDVENVLKDAANRNSKRSTNSTVSSLP